MIFIPSFLKLYHLSPVSDLRIFTEHNDEDGIKRNFIIQGY
jgi:hypothetical protein